MEIESDEGPSHPRKKFETLENQLPSMVHKFRLRYAFVIYAIDLRTAVGHRKEAQGNMVLKSTIRKRSQEKTIGLVLLSFLISTAPTVLAADDHEPTVISADNQEQRDTEGSLWLSGINKTKTQAEPATIAVTPQAVSTETQTLSKNSNTLFDETGARQGFDQKPDLDSDLPMNLAQAIPSGVNGSQVNPAAINLAQANPVVNGRIEPSTSDPSVASNRIEELTKQAMLKIIELERFNLNYKANAAKQGRWKGWRYSLFNEIDGSLALTGGIISIHNRGSHLHSSNKVKTYIQEDANIFPMIGSIIGASAAAMEFGINEYHEYQAFRNGYSPGRARIKVASLRAEIDKILTDRESLVSVEKTATTETGWEIDSLEGRVLKDLRDQALLEFQRYHIGARRLMAFQQSQYFFDFAKNVTNAIGCEFAYLSLHRGRRVWNGRAGTLFDVSGAITMGGPIVSRAIGKLAGEYHKQYIKESIGEAEAKECAILERDQKELESYCRSNKVSMDVVGKVVDRSASYGDQSKIFQDEIQSSSKQLDKAKLVATQNIGAGLYKGGSKLASGILFNACGYPQLYNSKTQTATRVTNHLLFSASVVGLPATAFAMADTLRIQVTGELNRKKLAAKGELPVQLIKKRLAQLDELEAKLKAQ